jgi:hypothetical protein
VYTLSITVVNIASEQEKKQYFKDMLNGKKMEENLSLVNNFQITSLKERQKVGVMISLILIEKGF